MRYSQLLGLHEQVGLAPLTGDSSSLFLPMGFKSFIFPLMGSPFNLCHREDAVLYLTSDTSGELPKKLNIPILTSFFLLF